MKSRITEDFLGLFRKLPAEAQRQTRAAYRLFKENPRHSSLRIKRISASDSSLYSACIGDHYRAIGFLESDMMTWFWVGTHGVPRIGPGKDSCETQGRLRANTSRAMSGA